jgi:hypothetical protein
MTDRLDANDFIQQIRVAEKWAVRVLDGELELKIVDQSGNDIQYLAPILDVHSVVDVQEYADFLIEMAVIMEEKTGRRVWNWHHW